MKKEMIIMMMVMMMAKITQMKMARMEMMLLQGIEILIKNDEGHDDDGERDEENYCKEDGIDYALMLI